MSPTLQERARALLRWSEKYTGTDMVYLAGSGFWMNLGTVAVSLFSLGLYVIFAHLLTPQVYGTYQYLLSAGALIGALTLTGMNSAVTRAVAMGHEGVFRYTVRLQLRWGLLPFCIAVLLALYYFFQGNVVLGYGFLLIGVFTPITNALNTYSAFLTGKKDFRRAFEYNFNINVFFYGALAIVAFTVPAVLALIAANLITQAVGVYGAYRATLKARPPNDSLDPDTVSYGKHLSLMGIFGALALQADNLLVFHFLGAPALALYSFATAIPDRIVGLFKFLPVSFLPKLSGRTSTEVRSALSWRTALSILVVSLGSIGIYILVAPSLFSLLFPTYIEAVPYSSLYALTIVVVLGNVFYAGLLAEKRVRGLYAYNISVPLIQLAVQCVGIIWFGLWGLIVAKIASSLVLIAVSAFLLFRRGPDFDAATDKA